MGMKSFIFIWRVDCSSVSPADVPTYMQGAKASLGADEELSDLLQGEVLTYFIPVQTETTLEVLEFNTDLKIPMTRNSRPVEAKFEVVKERIFDLLKEVNDG
jgi:hypothetical protein